MTIGISAVAISHIRDHLEKLVIHGRIAEHQESGLIDEII